MKTHRWIVLVCALGAATSLSFGFGPGDLAKKVGEKAVEKAVTDPNAVKGVTGLTLEEEINIGDSVSVEIVGRYGGIWRNTVATQRVNVVGRTLARFAKRGSLDWRFGLLNSDAINAFSAPNGRVFITKGLYKLLENDDELAGVLAHEIAHIDLRHAAKIIAGGQAAGAGGQILGEVASEELGNKYGNLPIADQLVEKGVANFAKGLFTNGYGSSREFDADKSGYELARVTGFASDGLRIALTKVEANTSHAKETFSTHPKTSERLKKLPGAAKKGK